MSGLLNGKRGLVFGVANQRSIAWAVAELAREHGARVGLGVQNERMLASVQKITEGKDGYEFYIADLNEDEQIARCAGEVKERMGSLDFLVHSVAFALREELAGRFLDTSREGFRVALETSAYSLVALVKGMEPLLNEHASIVTMTFLGSERVFPGYNVMGVAKAALESVTRYLAYDLGKRGIRVNAVSPGPIQTVSARGVRDFSRIMDIVQEKAPLSYLSEQSHVAGTTLFLLSDLSRGVTGEVIFVDSGYRIVGT
ncbi:MAG: enoyl-ACP reductase [Fimbriimonadales bacterium]|nr:enoyl-ACP reductase [Fimbriimonadales bacterium]